MSDFQDFIEFVEYTKRYKEGGPRRYLRDYSDPFTKYSEQEFHARYRFMPGTVKNVILPMLASDLRKPTKRGLPFAPEIMILITLRYFASGSFQKMDGDMMNVCQQSVSRIIAQVSTLIARKLRHFVKFPSTAEDINTVKQKFYGLANFPEVIGCIACTHIKIRNPGGATAEVFKNSKGWFSIKVQAVTGPNLEFYDLVARWPGSKHDSFIYDNSTIKQRLNTGVLQGIILGGSAYEVSNVLLTPFLSLDSTSQEAYNRSHITTHSTTERCFEIWKKRFPCLQVGMGVKVETVVAIICACATLHNIAILTDDFLPLNSVELIDDNVDVMAVSEDCNSDGYRMREDLVERFFPNY